jgi:hypothetical protein
MHMQRGVWFGIVLICVLLWRLPRHVGFVLSQPLEKSTAYVVTGDLLIGPRVRFPSPWGLKDGQQIPCFYFHAFAHHQLSPEGFKCIRIGPRESWICSLQRVSPKEYCLAEIYRYDCWQVGKYVVGQCIMSVTISQVLPF